MYFFKSIFSGTFAVRFEDRRGFSYVVFNRAGDHNRQIGLSLYNNLWPENIVGTSVFMAVVIALLILVVLIIIYKKYDRRPIANYDNCCAIRVVPWSLSFLSGLHSLL